jgi:hypothetical protein
LFLERERELKEELQKAPPDRRPSHEEAQGVVLLGRDLNSHRCRVFFLAASV